MSALEFSRNYFNVCRDLHYARYWGAKDRALLALKISSYFTVIIPIGVAITYAVSKHSHNVQVISEGEALIFKLDRNNYEFRELLVPDVKKVCSAAKKQFQKGNISESRKLLTQIKHHTDKKSALIMEHLNSLELIAKAQLKTSQVQEALTTIKSIVEQIPELQETSPEIIKYQTLATLLIPVDSKFAHTLLDKATERVETYEKIMIHRYGEVGSYEEGEIKGWRDELNELRAKLPEKL